MSAVNTRRQSPWALQRGLSLVELMVAMAIGIFLVAGAITVFGKTRDLYRTNEDAARLQEVARYAMSTIEADVRMANYWGLNSRSDLVSNTVASTDYDTACGDDWSVAVRRYIDGANGDGVTTYASYLGCPPDVGTAENNADIMTVRRAGVSALTPAQTLALNGRLKVATTRVQATLFDGPTMPSGFLQVRELITRTYYITADPAPADPVVGQPALRRKNLSVTGGAIDVEDQLIISGIEDLQFQVGVDTDGDADQDADYYMDPVDLENDLAPGDAVVAVRVWLLARSDRPEFSFTDDRTYQYADRAAFSPGDNFRRLLVSKTIHLRNTRR